MSALMINSAINPITVSCVSIDANANSNLVYAQATYAYKSVIAYTIPGTLTLSEKVYMMPGVSAPTYGWSTCT
jgi:hypothetical protein